MAVSRVLADAVVAGSNWNNESLALGTAVGAAKATAIGQVLQVDLGNPFASGANDGGNIVPNYSQPSSLKILCRASKANLKLKVRVYIDNTTDISNTYGPERTVPYNATNNVFGLLDGSNGVVFTPQNMTRALKEDNTPRLRAYISVASTNFSSGDWIEVDSISWEYTAIEAPDKIIAADFTATPATSTTVDLQWRYAASNTTSYKIYRATSPYDFSSATLIDDQHGANTHTDTGLSSGTVYAYWVVSHNEKWNGSTFDTNSDPVGPAFSGPVSASVTPAAVTHASSVINPFVVIPSISLVPAAASLRIRSKAPFQLAETDVDGFFQALAQAHAYTNFGYRKRDTYVATDQANHAVVWLYPTTSSDSFVKQLPRVVLVLSATTGMVGLGYPISPSQVASVGATVGAHSPLKTKNFFSIITAPPWRWRRRKGGILSIGAKYGSSDDTTSDTEVGVKNLHIMDLQAWAGINSDYGDARIITKFFRPDTSKPNIKTKILSIKPIFSHGNASFLTMRGLLWSSSTYLRDDNVYSRSPDFESTYIVDGGTILFTDSTFNLEHCVGLSFDTNDGLASIPIAHVYSGGSLTAIEIEYVEQEEGWS